MLSDNRSKIIEIEGFEFLELIGQGGMSLVYKARQQKLDRIVAIKILSKDTIVGEAAVKRFQQEAKFTSELKHTGIIQIFSAGVSSDGQAYLVMEYLDGLSLAETLKQGGRLTLQEFKDIFLPLLAALEQAHQAGLIHRDIKPANIMRCRVEGGDEVVKLVDFGIAKAIDDGQTPGQHLTQTGALVGSPSYMSPEQCQGNALDRRSDLYSMACVMYESISGSPPFCGETSLVVMQKHVVEAPPTIVELKRKVEIRDDLARAILRGLAKDPAARPQTAVEFSRELAEALEDATLDKVPLLKEKPKFQQSPVYSTSSFWLAGLCMLLLGGAVSLWRVSANKSKREQALDSSIISKQTEEKTQETEARNCEDALTLYERNHPVDLELAKRLDHLGHDLYLPLKQYGKAERALKKALEIRTTLCGNKNPLVVHSAIRLAGVYAATRSDLKREQMLLLALNTQERMFGAGDIRIAETLCYLGDFYDQTERTEKAESFLRRALALKEADDPKHKDVNELMFRLGDLCLRQREFAQAEKMFKRLVRSKEHAGVIDLDYSRDLANLGEVYRSQGRFTEAQPLLERGLELREKFSDQSSSDFGRNLVHLAEVYQHQGKYPDAAKLFERALRVRQKTLGPDHRAVADVLYGLGSVYVLQKKYVEAESLLKQGLQIKEAELGVEHPSVATGAYWLGILYQSEGKSAQAELQLKRAVKILGKADGSQQVGALLMLAELYRAQSRFTEAEPLLKRALEIQEKMLRLDHPDIGKSLFCLGELYRAQGKYAEAAPLLTRGLRIREKVLGLEHPDTAITSFCLGELYVTQQKYAEAAPLLERFLQVAEKGSSPGELPDATRSTVYLRDCYRHLGKHAELEALLKRTTAARKN